MEFMTIEIPWDGDHGVRVENAEAWNQG